MVVVVVDWTPTMGHHEDGGLIVVAAAGGMRDKERTG